MLFFFLRNAFLFSESNGSNLQKSAVRGKNREDCCCIHNMTALLLWTSKDAADCVLASAVPRLVEDVMKNAGKGRFDCSSSEPHGVLLLLLYVLYCQGVTRNSFIALRSKLQSIRRKNWSGASIFLTFAIFSCLSLLLCFWKNVCTIGIAEMAVLLRTRCRAVLPWGREAVLRCTRSRTLHILHRDAATFSRLLLQRTSHRASLLWSSACTCAAGAGGSGGERQSGFARAASPAELWPCAAVLGLGLCRLWQRWSGRRALWRRAAGIRAQARIVPPDGGAVRLLAEGLDPRSGFGWAAGAAAEWGRCGAAERLGRLDKLARWAGYAGGVAVVVDRVDECAALAPRAAAPTAALDSQADCADPGPGLFAGSWCGLDGWAGVRRFVFLPVPRSRLLAQPARPIRLDKLKAPPPPPPRCRVPSA